MPSLWFVVPAHGRQRLARICLRQLRRTCDALTAAGIDASAVVIADDGNLRTARNLGFATVHRDNRFLSRKYNDGIQLALDDRYNPRPADYVVPCGSDDWVDWRLFTNLPPSDTVVGFQRISFVREDGQEMTTRFLNYLGGSGIRIYPRAVMAALGYRPADEDRERACDTSILTNLRREAAFRIEHRDLDPRQIVDWKSHDRQLNPYVTLRIHKAADRTDPFDALADIYPQAALREMRAHYRLKAGLVAA